MTKKAIARLTPKELREFMIMDQRMIRAQRKVIRLLKGVIQAKEDHTELLRQKCELVHSLDKLNRW